MRVLICPDSFKLSASAREVARALSSGAHATAEKLNIDLSTDIVPLSDGGEGFLDSVSSVVAVEERVALCPHVDGGAGLRQARWVIEPETRTAFGECAEVVGLGITHSASPENRTAVGIGTYLGIMARSGATKIILGVGGTATVDGGASVAFGLGARFLRQGHGIDVSHARDAVEADQILLPQLSQPPTLECWCDVDTPLIGERGAVTTFAPQKGATPKWVRREDRAVTQWAQSMAALHDVVATAPGTGAGGGIPFGVALVLGGQIRPGAEAVCNLVGLEEAVVSADLVWTGEGRADHTTSVGKLPSVVRRLCQKHGKELTVFAGQVDENLRQIWPDVEFVSLVGPTTTLEESLSDPQRALRRRASEHLAKHRR